MAFVEVRLLDCVAYGTQGGPTWLTRRVALRSGIVRRNPLRSLPLYRFAVIYKNLEPASHADVIAAFNAVLGGVHSFRLKDWADFEAVDQPMSALGTGAQQVLPLRKLYTFGNLTIARTIRKPVPGTVSMESNGAPISSAIDYTTGIATYTGGAGHIVTWSGEFDVPVMFEDDELSFSNDDRGADGLFLTSDVGLIEDRSA